MMNGDQDKSKPWPLFCLAAVLAVVAGIILGGRIGWGLGSGDLPSPEVTAMGGAMVGGFIGMILALNFGVIAYQRGEIRFRRR